MKSWIREKKYECGEYRTVGIYAVTDQEHRQRGRKHKESSRGQKARNKNASMRRYQRKVLANFDKDGFYVTGTYEDAYRPESFEDCVQDVRNYVRRVKAAVIRRFGEQRARRLKLSLHAVRNGEKGKLHMHGFAECKGLTTAERREFRAILEELWRRRVPGTSEYEPLGTMNADRIDMKKILGIDGDGKNGTVGYIYGHSERRCVETRNLTDAGRAAGGRHQVEPPPAAQGLRRVRRKQLLVGEALPRVGGGAGDDLRPAAAARDRKAAAGRVGDHRPAGVSDPETAREPSQCAVRQCRRCLQLSQRASSAQRIRLRKFAHDR